MKILKLAFLLFLSTICGAQTLEKVFETELTPDFTDYFKSSKKRQFYLIEDGSKILLNTEVGYKVLDMTKNGAIIGEGKHVVKTSDLSASALGVLKNKSLNREDAINTLNFKEGSEYIIFEDEAIALLLDWNVSKNVVKAVDLQSGKLMWENGNYRFTPSAAEQFANQFVGIALAQSVSNSTNYGMNVNSAVLTGLSTTAVRSALFTDLARAFVTPFYGTGIFMLKTNDGYKGISLKTGEELWAYNGDINIGFFTMTNDNNAVLVNFNSSYFKSGKNLIVKLNVKTGKEMWQASHLSNFKEGRTFAVGNRLICDYYGAEVFDLSTGERVLLSIDEKTVKTQNTMTTMFGNSNGERNTESIASPSVIEGDYLYTATFKLGPRVFANDGSSKAQIQKYDLVSGDQLWNSDKLAKGTDLVYASTDHVFVRKGKAFGKSSLFILDASSGEELIETEDVDGFVYREGANDVLTDEYLYRSGKKDVYSFDVGNWDNVKSFDVKSIKLGKLQALSPSASSDLMVIGDKGLGFYTESGELIYNKSIEVNGAQWNQNFCYLYSDENTSIVNKMDKKDIGQIDNSPSRGDLYLISEEGKNLVVIENENNTSGKKSMKYYTIEN